MVDNGLVVALVRAHLLSEPEYLTFVKPYIKVRLQGQGNGSVITRFVYEHVGGHTRRIAHAKRSIDMLACVCKQPVLMGVEEGQPPVGKARRRS